MATPWSSPRWRSPKPALAQLWLLELASRALYDVVVGSTYYDSHASQVRTSMSLRYYDAMREKNIQPKIYGDVKIETK
jgi:hypothetical protein